MIGAEDVRVDLRVGDAWGDGAARQPVVDTPADVAGAGVGPMRPPGCISRSRQDGLLERYRQNQRRGNPGVRALRR